MQFSYLVNVWFWRCFLSYLSFNFLRIRKIEVGSGPRGIILDSWDLRNDYIQYFM